MNNQSNKKHHEYADDFLANVAECKKKEFS